MIRLAVRVAREDAEAALAELLAFAPGGVEEVDVSAAVVEYVLYGAAGELPSIGVLRASVGDALVDVATSEIDDDWGERWRAFHQPIEVAGRLWVRAPWHQGAGLSAGSRSGTGGLIDIAIEPGQAFGTGSHATTRLCLELLVGMAERGEAGGTLIDVGCGSGVLAIAGAKLGWAPVYGLDHEVASVAAANENAAANGVAVAISRVDLRREGLGDVVDAAVLAPATVVANLVRGLLLELCEVLATAPATLIVSGLLEGEADEVAEAFAARHGMVARERATAGAMDGGAGWVALRLTGGERRVSS